LLKARLLSVKKHQRICGHQNGRILFQRRRNLEIMTKEKAKGRKERQIAKITSVTLLNLAKPGRIGELSMGKFLIQNVAQVMLSFWCPQGRCKAKAELWLLRERVGTELLSSSPSSQRVKH
jgi:hypothetical protein